MDRPLSATNYFIPIKQIFGLSNLRLKKNHTNFLGPILTSTKHTLSLSPLCQLFFKV